MITIIGKSKRPCFLCGKNDAAEVKFKDGTFTGTICREHLWERVVKKPEKTEKTDEEKATEKAAKKAATTSET